MLCPEDEGEMRDREKKLSIWSAYEGIPGKLGDPHIDFLLCVSASDTWLLSCNGFT
jgi:hypothetical protein